MVEVRGGTSLRIRGQDGCGLVCYFCPLPRSDSWSSTHALEHVGGTEKVFEVSMHPYALVIGSHVRDVPVIHSDLRARTQGR